MRKVIVSGGSGFIGSALVYHLLARGDVQVVNVDKLTYAANPKSLEVAEDQPNYSFELADICDLDRMREIVETWRPDAIVHLAAESHVDRSIDGPAAFVQTNIVGTQNLLDCALDHWSALEPVAKRAFRFLHVSTDEVFGSLGPSGQFSEESPYRPNSPYSASKAASDHLVRAWHETYGLPTLISNCTNNYGPRQHPEKLIPTVILKALTEEPIPVYGKGENVRDWLYVEDHAEALIRILERGIPGETYGVGGGCEKRNIELVRALCRLLDEMAPAAIGHCYEELITFVTDRLGHDYRYSMDSGKICRELGWQPRHSFEQGLRLTVRWYLDNRAWWETIIEEGYNAGRLGLVRDGRLAGSARRQAGDAA